VRRVLEEVLPRRREAWAERLLLALWLHAGGSEVMARWTVAGLRGASARVVAQATPGRLAGDASDRRAPHLRGAGQDVVTARQHRSVSFRRDRLRLLATRPFPQGI